MLTALLLACLPLPADFDDNRVFLKIAAGSETLRFYTDSGGGLYPFVYDDTARKLGMTIESTVTEPDFTLGLSTFPQSLQQQHIPLPLSWKSHVRVFTYREGGSDEASEGRFFLGDGFFGATFFADKVWRFNYPAGTLEVCSDATTKEMKQIPMHFKVEDGVRTSHQPRIDVEILGEKVPVLFDTGATSFYSKEAVALIQPAKPFTASSFIRQSMADKWIKAHPEWRVVRNGEKFAGGGDLVEVPLVTIAGVSVGPIWFATRKDEIYDYYSKAYMGSHIEGAVGGNLFRTLEMVVDYPGARLFVR